MADQRKPGLLPGGYSAFSETDVLRLVYGDYDPTTGKTSAVRDDQNQPSSVSILQAKLWKVAEGDYLVVLSGLGAGAEFLCGNCTMYTPLAVLKTNGTRLLLVARQDLPRSSEVADDFYGRQFGSLSYSGHESISLDLAPYRLTARETLIGVRIEHMWLAGPFYNTNLLLFRLEDGRLRNVFEKVIVDRDYPDAHKVGWQTILKTVSTLSITPSKQRFNELTIKSVEFRCRQNDDGDCGSGDDPAVKKIKAWSETWRFDGERFARVTTP